jgi:hypothetical protein
MVGITLEKNIAIQRGPRNRITFLLYSLPKFLAGSGTTTVPAENAIGEPEQEDDVYL